MRLPEIRRDGRAAEGSRLESVYTGNRIVGSNPTPSDPRRPFDVKRAPGRQLGNPRNIWTAGELGRKALVSAADQFARDILPAVNAIRNAGTISLQGISEALNKQGIKTPRGKRWHVSSVANVLSRANLLADARS